MSRAECRASCVPRMWIGRAAALAALLCAGCVEETYEAASIDATGDTLSMDTGGAALPQPTNGLQPLRPTPPPPTVSLPASRPDRSADTTRVVRAVFGTAEIQVDSSTFAPADYLRVLLQNEQRSFETLTDRSGQFVFENVPAGRYQVVFITATKDAREVHRAPVTLEAGGKVALPAIHIPLRSLRAR